MYYLDRYIIIFNLSIDLWRE